MRPRTLKHLRFERTRHGRNVIYFQRGDGPRIRLPDSLDDPTFHDRYMAALVSPKAIPLPVSEPPVEPDTIQRVERQLKRALLKARERAVAKEMPFDLDLDWALSTVKANGFRCPLTGLPFFAKTSVTSAMNPYAPSLDQIRPGEGYTRDNTRIVVFAINAMFLDWGPAVFERVTTGYRRTKSRLTA